MAQNEITLKVAEALSQRDIGQGIARLDPKTMNDLGINERDLIEITGEKKTAAIALPSQTDIGLGVIRIDGLVRKNSGATIGGEVTIKKAQAIEHSCTRRCTWIIPRKSNGSRRYHRISNQNQASKYGNGL